MGTSCGWVERAQERLDHTKAEALEKTLRKERFTLEISWTAPGDEELGPLTSS